MYEGKCDVEVENRFSSKSLSYRPITLGNPFPQQAVSGIPSNWQEFYPAKKDRLESTYDNEPLYKINLTKEKIEKLEAFNNTTYNSWENMDMSVGPNVPETSKVIVPSIFDKRATKESYCKLGTFSEDCDKEK